MSLKPWKVLESRRLHKHVRLDTCETQRGVVLDAVIMEYGHWVNLLALTEDQQVVLVRQYRHGIRECIWELPGGMLEEGETPLEGGKRELLEETGYTGGRFIEVGKSFPNAASHTNSHYSVLALDVKKVSGQALDDTEDIEVALFPLEEVIAMARRGELPNPMQITALFYALAHMQRI
jgi:8-oxo-dGTP pyrophosphatase MutT (NUDIX family)